MKSAVIVIPTTGSPTLSDAIQSAVSQDWGNTSVWVIIDGPQYEGLVNPLKSKFPSVKFCTLPDNTGANGFYGHRIYSAVSYLFNEDYISYLDQDNWFKPNHITSVVTKCETDKLDWCHSLREIYDKDANYICDDDCESLGRYPIYLNDSAFLVDTSTYCIRRETILNMGPAWYSGWGGDRRFYSIISQHVPNFGCTGKSTVCYRLDGNPGSVNAEFFVNGNAIMKSKYPGGFPWKK